jgi:hypothetical protein
VLDLCAITFDSVDSFVKIIINTVARFILNTYITTRLKKLSP